MPAQASALAAEVSPALPRLLLVGNPNVGKSVVFGHLTGTYVTVSNYPGTTVEVTRGAAVLDGDRVEVIDTPGTNNLIPVSEDERVTRDLLLGEVSTPVLQVGDAKNLRRVLLLSLQLAETGVPFVLVLNMMDEARARGIVIDVAALERRLGVPVVPAVAIRGEGLDQVRARVKEALPSPMRPVYSPELERAIAAIEARLPAGTPGRRSLAGMVLAGDRSVDTLLAPLLGRAACDALHAEAGRASAAFEGGASYRLNVERLQQVQALVDAVCRQPAARRSSLLERAGLLAMHPVWGWPILAAVLFVVYEFVGVLGAGTLVDLLENKLFGEWINPWSTRLVDAVLPSAFVHDLLVGPYGVITMALSYGIAIVLPIVGTFFVAFSFMEDSGYLPRLAVMVDRGFRTMGLNGKAVLPMVLGLGCDTMATLTTRILETRKERLVVTLLLALGVPCSAQLGVVLGVLATLPGWATLVWGGVVAGTMLATGWLASRILPGQRSDFVLEVPPLRRPQASNILIKTSARIEWYLREALPLFVVGTLILFTLDRLDLLTGIQRFTAPAVQGVLGLPAQASEAFLVGFLRRDYGATMFFDMSRTGSLDAIQTSVALVTITLFMPCIANFFMIVREQGLRVATAMAVVVLGVALGIGAVLNVALRAWISS